MSPKEIRQKSKRRGGKKGKTSISSFDHVQARLKWARSARDTKLWKISLKKNEIREIKNEMKAKLLEIGLLEVERDASSIRRGLENFLV